MDGVDPGVVLAAENSLSSTTGVVRVRQLRVRWLGHTLHLEADLEVDSGLSLTGAHQIAHHAEAQLIADVRRVTSATIHTSPAGFHQHSAV